MEALQMECMLKYMYTVQATQPNKWMNCKYQHKMITVCEDELHGDAFNIEFKTMDNCGYTILIPVVPLKLR